VTSHKKDVLFLSDVADVPPTCGIREDSAEKTE
jgi:hypothetical protein